MTTPTPTRGPCAAWDPIFCCELTAAATSISGHMLQAATEILYNLSGQIFDPCQFTFRPCRRDCADNGWWNGGLLGGFGNGQWWEWGAIWPRPAFFDGAWFNLTCGGCQGSCSCNPLSEALLPSPISSIVSVKLDGQTLPASGYRVDDFKLLVRLGGEQWPLCQDMSLADDQPNTWSVTAIVGEQVPMLGRLAVGELACEMIAGCLGLACRLPGNATQVTRQGVTVDLDILEQFMKQGLIGLPLCDRFISTYNPQRLKAPPLVFDVDAEPYRRTGT